MQNMRGLLSLARLSQYRATSRLVQCSVKLHQVVHCSVFMGCNFVRHKPLSKVGLLYSDAGMHS